MASFAENVLGFSQSQSQSHEGSQQDLFDPDEQQQQDARSVVAVSATQAGNAPSVCEKKLDEILRRLACISDDIQQLKQKRSENTETFTEVRGSKLEIPLMERGAKSFLLDPFFAQKSDKVSWITALLRKQCIETHHFEKCRKELSRKSCDWRNNIRIKMLTKDKAVDSMQLADLKLYVFGGVRYLNSLTHTDACVHFLLILRWFVYIRKLFGSVEGRKTTCPSATSAFWGEFLAFWNEKLPALNDPQSWTTLAERDAARAERSRRNSETRNEA